MPHRVIIILNFIFDYPDGKAALVHSIARQKATRYAVSHDIEGIVVEGSPANHV